MGFGWTQCSHNGIFQLYLLCISVRKEILELVLSMTEQVMSLDLDEASCQRWSIGQN